MNEVFKKIVKDTIPPLSEEVCEGMSGHIVNEELIPFLDKFIRGSMKGVPKELEFQGINVLNPEELYYSNFNSNTLRTTYDISESSFYKIELIFLYQGKEIRRPLLMPFVTRNGIMSVSGVRYYITPILSDNVISVSNTNVFVKLLRNKITYEALTRNYYINGEYRIGQIIYSNIYRIDSKDSESDIGKTKNPVSMYLLCVYGIKETFKRFCDVEVELVYKDTYKEYDDNYTVYQSIDIEPIGVKRLNYRPHNIAIVLKTKNPTTLMNNICSGILYTMDIFPDYSKDILEVISHSVVAEKEFWILLYGRVTSKDTLTIDKMYDDMVTHLGILEYYLDQIIQEKLEKSNIYVNDFFELLIVLLDKYNDFILSSSELNNTANNKSLDIPYYVIYPIIIAVNKALFDITRRMSKKELSYIGVSKLLGDNIRQGTIYSIIKTSNINLSVRLVDYVGDNLAFNVTLQNDLQERGNGVIKSKENTFPVNVREVSALYGYIGNLFTLNKKSPTPILTLNPFLKVEGSKLLLSEQQVDVISDVNNIIKGKDTSDFTDDVPIFNTDEIDIEE